MSVKKSAPSTALAEESVTSTAATPAARPRKAAKRVTAAAAKDTAPSSRTKAAVTEAAADADFADLELDGDVEADAEELAGADKAADGSEAKAKVKPLRMKVPKSKERALIREFGLDVATLTEDEVEKRRSELRALVKMGKTRGSTRRPSAPASAGHAGPGNVGLATAEAAG